MTQEEEHRELVSALADGQLTGDEFARALECLSEKEDARLTWHAYHVVADVLRSGDAPSGVGDADFLSRLKASLQKEAELMPSGAEFDRLGREHSPPLEGVLEVRAKAANEPRYYWKALAAVASLAVALVVGWQAISGTGDSGALSKLAQIQLGKPDAVSPAVMDRGESPTMIRDPQLDALLAAHKQFGGTSAFQVPAGFLRNATFEGASR